MTVHLVAGIDGSGAALRRWIEPLTRPYGTRNCKRTMHPLWSAKGAMLSRWLSSAGGQEIWRELQQVMLLVGQPVVSVVRDHGKRAAHMVDHRVGHRTGVGADRSAAPAAAHHQ